MVAWSMSSAALARVLVACFVTGCLVACGDSRPAEDRDQSTADTSSQSDAPDAASADVVPTSPVCDYNDPDPQGPACVHSVPDQTTFDSISIGPTGVQHWQQATKYMVPVSDGAQFIPPLVQNARRFPVHMDFLSTFFFPGISLKAYGDLVTLRATRQYYAGNLIRIEDPVKGTLYGFTIYSAAKLSEQLEPVEVMRVYQQLSGVVTAGPLVYTFEPFDAMGPRKAKAWIDPGFPIWYPQQDDVKVEVYTAGVNYGTVRLFTLEQFEAAVEQGVPGYRDIVVIESVPFDIEAVVAGVITGGRQWELSHVNVRMARRGTPNLFVQDPLTQLADWSGKLVRLEVALGENGAQDRWSMTEASLEEAEAWWQAHRPKLDDVPAADSQYQLLDWVLQMDTDDDPVALVTLFGGKSTNLARLYAFLDPKYQVPAFGIPFAWFESFMETTTIENPWPGGQPLISLRGFVAQLAQDPQASLDPLLRHQLLETIRERIKSAPKNPALIQLLQERIVEVFGLPTVPVRFRSSSNIEDGLEFSGAGLYDSTTACVADQTDDDQSGPSRCNADEPNERTIERALGKVWASLYSNRAWDERDWYQVPQSAASMAILVSMAFPDEAANGVAFTGNPADPADVRYVINAQLGDETVVSNDPSKVPELVRLEMDQGQVSYIVRERSSTLAQPGVPVMSDALLEELGALMATIDALFPLDLNGYPREQVLLDLEFKVEKGAETLKIKQIRPFLMNTTRLLRYLDPPSSRVPRAGRRPSRGGDGNGEQWFSLGEGE